MIPYWLLLLLPAWTALVTYPSMTPAKRDRVPLIIFGIGLALMIGFRYQVGGDWGFEHRLFMRLQFLDFFEAIKEGDPGFSFIAWLFAGTGLNVWTLNLASGAIFSAGLIQFARYQPHPWLALVVAVPYLIIVVAMGYSRQSVAIGFLMMALVQLEKRKFINFNLLMLCAASVHTTAVLLMPLGIIGSRVNKTVAFLIGGPILVAAFVYILQSQVDRYLYGYVELLYQSDGALIRVTMNAVPAAIFLLFRKKFPLTIDQKTLMTVLSLSSFVFLIALAVSNATTAIDRMALYFIPLQLMVLARIPLAFSRSIREYRLLSATIIAYSIFVLYVWLVFARHSEYWIPYLSFPFLELSGLGGER